MALHYFVAVTRPRAAQSEAIVNRSGDAILNRDGADVVTRGEFITTGESIVDRTDTEILTRSGVTITLRRVDVSVEPDNLMTRLGDDILNRQGQMITGR